MFFLLHVCIFYAPNVSRTVGFISSKTLVLNVSRTPPLESETSGDFGVARPVSHVWPLVSVRGAENTTFGPWWVLSSPAHRSTQENAESNYPIP